MPLTTIPPLPPNWPFEARLAGLGLACRKPGEVPELGAEWSMFGLPELPFGESRDLGVAFGRGGVQRLGEVVLRPYRRGGLVRHLNERLYASPARFAQEFAVHRALWLAGFPTVEPLGYGWKRRAWGFEGCFLTRFTDCEPWPRAWTPAAVPPLLDLVRALCAWGLHAPDLNATNVMIAPDGQVLLLDWDRTAWKEGDLFPRYRARLLRSLAKLGAPEGLQAELKGWSDR